MAQQSTQPQLQNLLNNVDSPSGWSNVPTSGVPQGQQSPYIQPNANPAFMQPQSLTQPNNGTFGQQMLRTILGGSPQTSAAKGNNDDWSSSNAYSDWQEAENQASRAYNAEERARYDKDKGNRESDASEAYYASESARHASDRVYYASLNGDPTAKQYVDRAKAAADRARADSDRARADADRGD